MIMVWTYAFYLAISVALTVWVGWTLHKNGRLFLIDSVRGNEKLADSVNHLLLVGFYLINIGFLSLALKYGGLAHDVQSAIEYLSTKLGIVLLILGVMHFFNLAVLSGMRRRAMATPLEAIPVEPRRRYEERDYLARMRTVAVPVEPENGPQQR